MSEQALTYGSTKTYTHSQGLSCTFRQWKAFTSHCHLLHGYAIQVKLTFEGELDERNWVQDFGGLKEVKEFLVQTFDHKMIIAEDDPYKSLFEALNAAGVAEVVILPGVGCEKFAEYIFRQIEGMTFINGSLRNLQRVEVSEHEGNSAYVERASYSQRELEAISAQISVASEKFAQMQTLLPKEINKALKTRKIKGVL